MEHTTIPFFDEHRTMLLKSLLLSMWTIWNTSITESERVGDREREDACIFATVWYRKSSTHFFSSSPRFFPFKFLFALLIKSECVCCAAPLFIDWFKLENVCTSQTNRTETLLNEHKAWQGAFYFFLYEANSIILSSCAVMTTGVRKRKSKVVDREKERKNDEEHYRKSDR